jgi:tetratricopeptide (TPR) repeat protein
LALSGVLIISPGLARVQAADDPPRPKLTESQKQEVRDRYDKAMRFYYLRKYPEAIKEYEAIYLLSADPVMLFNIAQCHRQNDEPEKALQFYKNYLRSAPSAPNRADVEKKIAEMERLVEDRRRQTTPPAAVPPPVTPPTEPSSPAVGPPPAVPPPVDVAPPPTGVPGEPGAPEVAAAAAPARKPSRVLPISLVVGGGVFLTTSLVLGSVAAAKEKDVEEAARTRTRAFDQAIKNQEEAGRAANGLAVLTGVIGAAALGAGIYFWLRGDRSERAETQVIPVASHDFTGALARVRF